MRRSHCTSCRPLEIALVAAACVVVASCVPLPPLACATSSDCPVPSVCDLASEACVVVGDGGEGEGEPGEGEGEPGEGEGEGEGEIVFVTFALTPQPSEAYAPITLTWDVDNADACALALFDRPVATVPATGALALTPGSDGAIVMTCTNASTERAASVAVDVTLPAAIETSWALLDHPWRVDVTLASTGENRRAYPHDLSLDLAALLASADVSDVADPESVRVVARTGGAPTELELYFDDGLLFVPLSGLAANASTTVEVYAAPLATASPPWTASAYAGDYAGAPSPLILHVNQEPEPENAPLDVHGFDVSPEDSQNILYERAARLVVGADARTTSIRNFPPLEGFTALEGPLVRFASPVFNVIESRVQGPAGVAVRELLTFVDEFPAALRFTTVIENATAAAVAPVRFSTLLDLDVPEIRGDGTFTNTPHSFGGVPYVCEETVELCVAYAGDRSPERRVGVNPEVNDAFLGDDFSLGTTNDGDLDDMRVALSWSFPSIAAGAREVVHHAVAANDDPLAAEIDAVNQAHTIIVPLATTFSPLWVR